MRASLKVLAGASYPWSPAQLEDAALSPAALDRLRRAGWIRNAEEQSFEVWHDRLLNWTIAEALVDRVRAEPTSQDEVIKTVCTLLIEPIVPSGKDLGVVPSDFMWLILCNPSGTRFRQVIDATIDLMDGILGPGHSDRLYDELLPGLGSRILPHLLSRFEDNASNGHFHKITTLARAAAKLGCDEVVVEARRLLYDNRPFLQRAALRMLIVCPTPDVLDRLWAIHCQLCRDPSAHLQDGENEVFIYEDSFGALKSCARLDPEWICRQIQRERLPGEQVSDLAYLIANVGERESWYACKSKLFAEVDAAHERCLAVNILHYRDGAEIEWLVSRVSSTSDLIGSVAFRALNRVDIDRAFECLGQLNEAELYMSRNWCFAELLARDPKRTLDFVYQQIVSHPLPWRYALVFQGRERLLDGRILDVLLNSLCDLLAAKVADSGEGSSNVNLMPIFAFILAIGDAQLLALLRERRDQSLETKLTEWLLASGPRLGVYRDPERHDGLRVLALIGGRGLAEVVNDRLENGNNIAKFWAIRFSYRCSDPGTLEHLTRLSLSADLWNGHRLLQGEAALALAGRGCWNEVVAYYRHHGLEFVESIIECEPEAGSLNDDVLSDARDELYAEERPSFSSVLTLAFGRRSDVAPRIRTLLLSETPTSNLAAACAVALARFADTSLDVVPALRAMLNVDVRWKIAADALLANGTESARQALLDQLGRKFDHSLAAALLKSTSTVNDPVIRIVQKDLIRSDELDRINLLDTLLSVGVESEILAECVNQSDLLDFIREFAFAREVSVRVGGGRAVAIRLLAINHPSSAFHAAESALRDAHGPDRDRWPSILRELDSERSVQVLLGQAQVESEIPVIRAIGHALAQPLGSEEVRKWLSDPEFSKRLAASKVARWMGPDSVLLSSIRCCLDDPEYQVADESLKALEELSKAELSRNLVLRFNTEADVAHRWALLDGLLAIGDPGDEGRPVPWWARELGPNLSVAMRKYLGDEIKTKRHDLALTLR